MVSKNSFFICLSTLFYVLAVFVAGLLVKSNDPRLVANNSGNEGRDMVLKSPFVIALEDSHVKYLDKFANAAFVLSAFSAATSDGISTSSQKFSSVNLYRCSIYLQSCATVSSSVWTCSKFFLCDLQDKNHGHTLGWYRRCNSFCAACIYGFVQRRGG